jgi:hypothetical protein
MRTPRATWHWPFSANAPKRLASKPPLSPRIGGFNEDLRAFGIDELRAALRIQLTPGDIARFMRGLEVRTS